MLPNDKQPKIPTFPEKPDTPKIPTPADMLGKPVPKVPDMQALREQATVPGTDETGIPIKSTLPKASKVKESPKMPPLSENIEPHNKFIRGMPKMEIPVIPKIPSLGTGKILSQNAQGVPDFEQKRASAALADIPQKAILSGSIVRNSANGMLSYFSLITQKYGHGIIHAMVNFGHVTQNFMLFLIL